VAWLVKWRRLVEEKRVIRAVLRTDSIDMKKYWALGTEDLQGKVDCKKKKVEGVEICF
jgi:hypothetical protein